MKLSRKKPLKGNLLALFVVDLSENVWFPYVVVIDMCCAYTSSDQC